MSTGCLQRIIAITQVARGGPGKDYAAKLHDCGAITDGLTLSGLCRASDLKPPSTTPTSRQTNPGAAMRRQRTSSGDG